MIVTHIDAAKGQSASTTMEWLDLNPEIQLKEPVQPYCSGCTTRSSASLKRTIASAGMSMSRLPVNPAAAVPAPPPTRPPTTRPTPPVATPPTSMPIPAPPAIKAVERLPLPFLLRARSRVVSGYCVPFRVNEVNRNSSSDLPLKCPRRCDEHTSEL